MSKLQIITGHYGSGKTEFAVSLAMKLAKEGKRVALADLDIVNPYFRSRERADVMEKAGIRVISSSLGHSSTLDLPAVSAEIRGPIQDESMDVILDIGGDSVGARVLVNFLEDIKTRGYELNLVVNAYRPETRTADDVIRYIESIEFVSTLKFTGLISNTHLLRETTKEDVMAGLRLTKEVSERTHLPIVYTSAIGSALEGVEPESGELLEVGMYMRDAWM
ncbi:nucleotide-binding protein [Guggenheimella bovis]